MKRLYFLILLLALATVSNAQMWDWQWAKKYSNVSDPWPTEMIRHNDHLIITGEIIGSSTPGMFVMMIDTMGNSMWGQTFSMSSSQGMIKVKSVIADNNAIYVAGYFVQASLTVGSTTLVGDGYRDGFIVKLDMSGNPLWAMKYGGSGDDYILDLTMHNGQINVLGSFEGTAAFGSNTVTSVMAHNMIIGVLDPATGDLSSVMTKDADLQESGRLRFTSSNEYVILGDYVQQVNADTVSEYYGGNYPTPFLMKLNAAGTGLWAKELSGFGDSSGEELELDATDAMYADIFGGWTSGIQSDLNRYADHNSTPVWSYVVPAAGDYGTGSYIGDIQIMGNRIFMVGTSHNSNSYGDPNDDTAVLRIMEFTSSGSIAWQDSVNQPSGSGLNGEAIALGVGNNMFVAGSFDETISFDTITISSPGTKAIFVAKIGEPVITGIIAAHKDQLLDIHPNPSNGSFTLKGELAAGKAQLIIRNMQGQVVYSDRLSLAAGELNTNVSTGDLSNGIYMIELSNGNNSFKQKLVIAK